MFTAKQGPLSRSASYHGQGRDPADTWLSRRRPRYSLKLSFFRLFLTEVFLDRVIHNRFHAERPQTLQRRHDFYVIFSGYEMPVKRQLHEPDE